MMVVVDTAKKKRDLWAKDRTWCGWQIHGEYLISSYDISKCGAQLWRVWIPGSMPGLKYARNHGSDDYENHEDGDGDKSRGIMSGTLEVYNK